MATRSVPRKDEGVNLRYFSNSTDDTAIYLEDSMDESTARCISSSPSAVAILSPQRLPPSSCHVVDITEYDANSIGNGCGAKATRGRPLLDLTNAGAVRSTFVKSPTPRRSQLFSSASLRRSSSGTSGLSQKEGEEQQQQQHRNRHHTRHHTGSVSADQCLESAPQEERVVPLVEYERLQRERNRFEKMYEHQKILYEDMAGKQSETYGELQKKIIEVVALSSRNEESKRFIRQLKREMADNRTRVMNIQNRVLEESKQERSAREQYQKQLHEYEERYVVLIEEQEAKLVGLESLLKDVTCMKGECDRVQVSQLDALLKASYAKNTALFGELMRQGRQIDLLFEGKATLEKQLEQLRREKRDLEAAWAGERRRMGTETERYAAQVAEQQRSILELRQMLIRTLESATLAQGENNDDDDNDETDSSSYSSECSSPHARGIEDTECSEGGGRGESKKSEGEEVKRLSATAMFFRSPRGAAGEKDNAQPPLPHVERRSMELAMLSAQI